MSELITHPSFNSNFVNIQHKYLCECGMYGWLNIINQHLEPGTGLFLLYLPTFVRPICKGSSNREARQSWKGSELTHCGCKHIYHISPPDDNRRKREDRPRILETESANWRVWSLLHHRDLKKTYFKRIVGKVHLSPVSCLSESCFSVSLHLSYFYFSLSDFLCSFLMREINEWIGELCAMLYPTSSWEHSAAFGLCVFFSIYVYIHCICISFATVFVACAIVLYLYL